jgi:hypothetical protein
LLFGFEFNIRGKLGHQFVCAFVADIDRAGEIKVDLPSLFLLNMIAKLQEELPFQKLFAGAESSILKKRL